MAEITNYGDEGYDARKAAADAAEDEVADKLLSALRQAGRIKNNGIYQVREEPISEERRQELQAGLDQRKDGLSSRPPFADAYGKGGNGEGGIKYLRNNTPRSFSAAELENAKTWRPLAVAKPAAVLDSTTQPAPVLPAARQPEQPPTSPIEQLKIALRNGDGREVKRLAAVIAAKSHAIAAEKELAARQQAELEKVAATRAQADELAMEVVRKEARAEAEARWAASRQAQAGAAVIATQLQQPTSPLMGLVQEIVDNSAAMGQELLEAARQTRGELQVALATPQPSAD